MEDACTGSYVLSNTITCVGCSSWLAATALPSPPTSDRAAISANPRRSTLGIARQVGHITRLVITAAGFSEPRAWNRANVPLMLFLHDFCS